MELLKIASRAQILSALSKTAKESSIQWRLDGDHATGRLTEQVIGEYKKER